MKIILKNWRRRVYRAMKRGGFTQDARTKMHTDGMNCINGELANILSKIQHRKIWYHTVHEKYPLSRRIEMVMINAVDTNKFDVALEAIKILEQLPKATS